VLVAMSCTTRGFWVGKGPEGENMGGGATSDGEVFIKTQQLRSVLRGCSDSRPETPSSLQLKVFCWYGADLSENTLFLNLLQVASQLNTNTTMSFTL